MLENIKIFKDIKTNDSLRSGARGLVRPADTLHATAETGPGRSLQQDSGLVTQAGLDDSPAGKG